MPVLSEAIETTKLFPEASENDKYQSALFGRLVALLYKCYGIILTITAALLYSGQSLLMEVSTRTVDPLLLTIIMAIVMTLCSLVMLIFKGITPPKSKEHYVWLFFGGIATSAYLPLLSFGILHTDVGDAITVSYTSLALVGIISWVILQEPPWLIDILFCCLDFVGVVFIARPEMLFGNNNGLADNNHETRYLGIAFSFGSSIAISFVINLLRKHSQLGLHTFISLFVNGSVIGVTNVFLAAVLHRLHALSLLECIPPIGAGLCYFLAQLTLYYALESETSTLVTVILTTEIIFAFILQYLVLGVHPLWTSYVGAFVVIVSCVGITMREKFPYQKTKFEK